MEGLDVPDRHYVGAFRGEPGLGHLQVRVGASYGVAAAEASEELARFETKLQTLVAGLHAAAIRQPRCGGRGLRRWNARRLPRCRAPDPLAESVPLRAGRVHGRCPPISVPSRLQGCCAQAVGESGGGGIDLGVSSPRIWTRPPPSVPAQRLASLAETTQKMLLADRGSARPCTWTLEPSKRASPRWSRSRAALRWTRRGPAPCLPASHRRSARASGCIRTAVHSAELKQRTPKTWGQAVRRAPGSAIRERSGLLDQIAYRHDFRAFPSPMFSAPA
jgi:hypothetical protein